VAEARYFEDIVIGQTWITPARTVTEADLVTYARISGNYDGLELTGGGMVPDEVVFVLTSGLGFRVTAPQPQVLAFMMLDWQFHMPVRIGDTVHCRTRVTAKRGLKEGGVVVEKREIVNQRDEVVQEGEYKLLLARRGQPAAGAAS
jgi:acyl dehydratase